MGQRANERGVSDAIASVPYHDGRRAGLEGNPPSWVPGRPGDMEYEQWMQGWRSGNAERASRLLAEQQAAKRALTFPCRYVVGAACEAACGGRGLCLEVA